MSSPHRREGSQNTSPAGERWSPRAGLTASSRWLRHPRASLAPSAASTSSSSDGHPPRAGHCPRSETAPGHRTELPAGLRFRSVDTADGVGTEYAGGGRENQVRSCRGGGSAEPGGPCGGDHFGRATVPCQDPEAPVAGSGRISGARGCRCTQREDSAASWGLDTCARPGPC